MLHKLHEYAHVCVAVMYAVWYTVQSFDRLLERIVDTTKEVTAMRRSAIADASRAHCNEGLNKFKVKGAAQGRN